MSHFVVCERHRSAVEASDAAQINSRLVLTWVLLSGKLKPVRSQS